MTDDEQQTLRRSIEILLEDALEKVISRGLLYSTTRGLARRLTDQIIDQTQQITEVQKQPKTDD